ncbi:MAG: hypothetical protein SGPRY_003674, partial [Prymnesium sp.]
MLRTARSPPSLKTLVASRSIWLSRMYGRDIKGANLLVTKDGQVKLADFGVARKLSDVAQSASVVGTPYWMAPEIIQMSAFTTASDIWSLGCTIIELINGEPPHYDLAPISALYRIVQDPRPPFPKDISPLLVDFLSRCFTRDPDKRATAAQLRKVRCGAGFTACSFSSTAILNQLTFSFRTLSMIGCVSSPDRSRILEAIRAPLLNASHSSQFDNFKPKPIRCLKARMAIFRRRHLRTSTPVTPFLQGAAETIISSAAFRVMFVTEPLARASRSAQLGRVEGAQSSRSSSFSVGSVAERKPSINNQASLPQMPAYRGNLVELHGKELRGAIESSPSRQRTGAALHSPQRRPAEGLGHSGADREVSSDSASSLSHSHTYLSLPSAHLTQSPLLGGDKARLAAPAPAADGSGDARRLQDEVVRLNKSMAQTGANGLQPQCMGTAFDHDVFGRSSPKPYKICLPGSDGYANGGGDAPLSGYLWKRGSGWRSLTYQRRFVYLANDCLCYRAKAPVRAALLTISPDITLGTSSGVCLPILRQANRCGAAYHSFAQFEDLCSLLQTVEQGVLDGSSDKRIDLASVLNVRVHSKLKFEFELVCISRSFRLRAPSAQVG